MSALVTLGIMKPLLGWEGPVAVLIKSLSQSVLHLCSFIWLQIQQNNLLTLESWLADVLNLK